MGKAEARELERIFSEHKRGFLSRNSLRRNRDKEIEALFPFTVINDFRIFLNYAKFFFREYFNVCTSLIEEQLPSAKIYSSVGTPTRMKRYFVILVLGAYMCDDFTIDEKVEFLGKIAKLTESKCTTELRVNRKVAEAMLSDLKKQRTLDIVEKRELSLLAVFLREYADYLFMGEHPLSCQFFEPTTISGSTMLVRKFDWLDYGQYIKRFSSVEIREMFPRKTQDMKFDLFRGNLDHIPPYWEKTAGAVFCDGHAIRAIQDESQRIMTELQQALFDVKKHYARLSEPEREVEFAYMYSKEIIGLNSLVNRRWKLPEDARRAILKDSIASNLKNESGLRLYSDAYFQTLKCAIDTLRKQ